MTKYELASQLRQRLICRGDISKQYARTLSAQRVIMSYITCPDCSLPFLSPEQLAQATEEACCAETWLAIIQDMKHANDVAQEPPPLLTPPEPEHGH